MDGSDAYLGHPSEAVTDKDNTLPRFDLQMQTREVCDGKIQLLQEEDVCMRA